jgi:hypothetical protein
VVGTSPVKLVPLKPAVEAEDEQPETPIGEPPKPLAESLSGSLSPREDIKPADTSTEAAPTARRKLVREKRMLLTESENELFEDLVRTISTELKVKVKESNVLRACLSLLLHVEGELAKQCRRSGAVKRPRNDKPAEIAAFEEYLARIFDSAIRNTKKLD